MFIWKKAEKSVNAQSETERKALSFAAEERERRRKAESFLSSISNVIQIVIPDFFGSEEKEIELEGGVFYSMNKKFFYIPSYAVVGVDGTDTDEGRVNILTLKGKPFWESVQQIMEYAHNLLDDLEHREEGRKRLVQDMEMLNRRMDHKDAVWHSPRL
ncbi:hypothetical protein D3C81_1045500 [compost metagenome]|uniref:hypothetical protein n=1 Tax=Paenibacillus TaxID=44249 RepID=UPI000F9E8FB7|nr:MULTISPECIES: hypothetical protein [Paenibacillus]MBY9079526.1 hypothetical protein [Paenibacillus sp. CGMCC 1.18879]MBY9087936.1 hypothetical protein [Paenibacillus sinensis]